jgi:integrase
MHAQVTAGRTVATVQAHLAAIATQHRLHGHAINRAAIADSAKGMRRLYARPLRQARPILGSDLQALLASLDANRAADVRDGAILALGWSGALRQSEIVGLDWRKSGTGTGVLSTSARGLNIKLTRSKTAQDKVVDLPVPAEDMPAAITWVRRWVALAGTEDRAPLFRPIDRMGTISDKRLTAKSVAEIIRKRVQALKRAEGASEEDAFDEAQSVSGHSLRAGFCTTAALKEVPEWKIRRRVRHATAEMTARYVRAAETWADSGLRGIGI